jgi:hypothetical protein
LKKALNGRVSETERMQIKLQKRLEQSKEVEGTTRQMINEIKVDVIGIKENVAELDSAIPAQFRRRPTASEPRVKKLSTARRDLRDYLERRTAPVLPLVCGMLISWNHAFH